MDPIQMLESQHDEVDALFAKFTRTHTPEGQRAVFQELADLLIAHTAIEEQIFYPAVYGGELQEQHAEAVREHASMKRLILQLLELQPEDPRFGVKWKELQEEVEAHVGEEEDELFPLVRQSVDKAELASLTEEMEELFDDLMDGSPRDDLVERTDAASLS